MKKLLTHISLGIAALVGAGAAQAAVMDFDTNVDYSNATDYAFGGLLGSGDAIVQGNYFAQTLDAAGDINPGILAGIVSNSSNASSCLTTCPSNASTHGNFLSTFDDAQVAFGKLDGSALTINSLSAAFIAAPSAPAGATIILAIEADTASSYIAYGWTLGTTGAFQTIDTTKGFQTLYSSGAGASFTQNVLNYYVFGYYCATAGSSCQAFKTDLAQFAIDDVTFDVTAVPEPSEWMLMGLGLAAVGAAA